MSHWITSRPEFGISYLAQISASTNQLHLQTRQQSDETFEDIKAIAELEPSGIVHIAVLFPFFQIVNSILFGDVLLLGCQPLVQKLLFTGKV